MWHGLILRVNLCKGGGMEGNSRAFGNRLANKFVVGMIFFFRATSNFLLIFFLINLFFHDQ